jgi:hypothetical protein
MARSWIDSLPELQIKSHRALRRLIAKSPKMAILVHQQHVSPL